MSQAGESQVNKTTVIIGLALIVLMPELAHAQAVTGGGQLSALLQWVVTNVVRVGINAAVLGVAITLLMFRFSYVFVGFVAVGGLVAANYASIAGMFGI
jgi:hypothetical protein